MKTFLRFVGIVMPFFVITGTGMINSNPVAGQSVSLTKTFALPEQAQKGVLIDFEFDQASGNYILTYTVGKKKDTRFENYYFDREFNFLKSDIPSDLTVENATSRYPYYDFDKGEITGKSRKLTEGEILDENDKSVVYKYAIDKKSFSMSKWKDGEVVYQKQIPFDDFEKNFKFPPSGDKGKPCNEKSNKYVIVSHYVSPTGHVFILGQNKDKGGAMGGMQFMSEGKASTKYKDCFIFHFDPQGNLVSQYSYDTKWSANTSPCEQYLLKGKNDQQIYWMILPNTFDDMLGMGFIYMMPEIAMIDFRQGSMGNFVKFQKEIKIKEMKALDPLYPFVTPEPGSLVLLGKDKISASKSGKVISFIKINLD